MIRTLKVQLGRSVNNLFEYTYDTENKSSVERLCNEYRTFFDNYRKTHSVSSRRWNFPVLYFKDNDGEFYPRYRVCPNGSWDDYE